MLNRRQQAPDVLAVKWGDGQTDGDGGVFGSLYSELPQLDPDGPRVRTTHNNLPTNIILD